ncbi:MAG: ATP-binding protein, partial [Deltaproteobacteria bacterium]|nr:ATP-binding protein [Deltaproteobacteria bacterium]
MSSEFKESETVELKRSTSERKEAIVSIASILNKHQRGELYFGLRNDGEVIGQDVTEKSIRDVTQGISNHIEPRIYPEVKRIYIEGKSCIV